MTLKHGEHSLPNESFLWSDKCDRFGNRLIDFEPFEYRAGQVRPSTILDSKTFPLETKFEKRGPLSFPSSASDSAYAGISSPYEELTYEDSIFEAKVNDRSLRSRASNASESSAVGRHEAQNIEAKLLKRTADFSELAKDSCKDKLRNNGRGSSLRATDAKCQPKVTKRKKMIHRRSLPKPFYSCQEPPSVTNDDIKAYIEERLRIIESQMLKGPRSLDDDNLRIQLPKPIEPKYSSSTDQVNINKEIVLKDVFKILTSKDEEENFKSFKLLDASSKGKSKNIFHQKPTEEVNQKKEIAPTELGSKSSTDLYTFKSHINSLFNSVPNYSSAEVKSLNSLRLSNEEHHGEGVNDTPFNQGTMGKRKPASGFPKVLLSFPAPRSYLGQIPRQVKENKNGTDHVNQNLYFLHQIPENLPVRKAMVRRLEESRSLSLKDEPWKKRIAENQREKEEEKDNIEGGKRTNEDEEEEEAAEVEENCKFEDLYRQVEVVSSQNEEGAPMSLQRMETNPSFVENKVELSRPVHSLPPSYAAATEGQGSFKREPVDTTDHYSCSLCQGLISDNCDSTCSLCRYIEMDRDAWRTPSRSGGFDCDLFLQNESRAVKQSFPRDEVEESSRKIKKSDLQNTAKGPHL